MNIEHNNKKVEKFFTNWADIYKKIGKIQAKSLKKRIDILKAATNFGIVIKMSAGKLESLSGNLNGCFKMNLSKNFRFIFRPERVSDDIRECDTVKIIGICDYHGKKENWIIR